MSDTPGHDPMAFEKLRLRCIKHSIPLYLSVIALCFLGQLEPPPAHWVSTLFMSAFVASSIYMLTRTYDPDKRGASLLAIVLYACIPMMCLPIFMSIVTKLGEFFGR